MLSYQSKMRIKLVKRMIKIMTLKNKKQIRTVEFRGVSVELDNNEMILQGCAAVYDSPTVLWKSAEGVEFKEVVVNGAFNGANFKNCCLKYDHATRGIPILARTRGGSLQVNLDNIGLKFRAKLFNTTFGNDVYTLAKEGGIDQCSFGFIVQEEAYDTETRTRKILKIKEVVDISVLPVPAYEDTYFEARSLFEAERAKEQALDREELAKRLIVRTYL